MNRLKTEILPNKKVRVVCNVCEYWQDLERFPRNKRWKCPVCASRSKNRKPTKGSGKPLTPRKQLFEECKRLWQIAVKTRAGWKSELDDTPARINKQGKRVGLAGHHMCGVSNYWLRFSLLSGICLTNGQHCYVAHVQGRKYRVEDKFKELRGKDIIEDLEFLKHKKGKPDLEEVRDILKQEIATYEAV